ncbi:uncharacterized protein LOC142624823 [Castanea sativa]|uniref:uncharacterized protein LOC142624823 n=1 Tax=Castanea sativa TaxID=21020 RepID=UPI003F651228
MQGDATVTTFFTDLQASWDQLLNLRPLPCCSCGKCVCGVNDKITSFHHQDSLMQFFNGLNEVYSQVRTQILMMEPSPSIDKAFSLVIQEERQRALGFNGGGPSVDSTALAVKTQGFNQVGKNTKGKGRPICSHCGKAGHFMEKCYKLIGFPPGFKEKGKASMANQVSLDGEPGHFEAASQSGSFPFTIEQCQQLLSLLSSHASSSATTDAIHSANSALSGISCASFLDSACLSLKNSIFTENPSNKIAYNEETWVLDIGAIDHYIHSISLYTKITSSISSFVHFPNGEKVLATHIGTVQVTASLILEDDLTCWKMIGLGKLHNNLYLLQASTNCKSISEPSTVLESVVQSFAHSVLHVPIVTKPYLWHLRLGHVSNAKLQHCISDGYKLLNLITKQIFISRDVSFHETVFPFITSVHSPHNSISLPHIRPNVALPHDPMFSDPITPSLHVPSSISSPNQVSDTALPVIFDFDTPESIPPDSVDNGSLPIPVISDSVIPESLTPGSVEHNSLPIPQGPPISFLKKIFSAY